MPENASLPSLVVFGPLTFLSSTAARLDNIRKCLQQWPYSGPLIKVIQDLEGAWYHLAASTSDPVIAAPCGLAAAKLLSNNLTGSKPSHALSAEQEKWSSIIVPLGVLTQVLHYLNFCQKNGIDHSELAVAVRRAGGSQGCCGGMLSALAIAAAEREEDIALSAAWALRLAFVIGCWIDADNAKQERDGSASVTLAIKWKPDNGIEEIIEQVEKHPGAYVAIVLDQNRATIITPRRSCDALSAALSSIKVVVRECGISGRYHNEDHAHVVERIRRTLPTGFPTCPTTSVRSNASGELIGDEDVSRVVLQCIIAQRVEWYSTITAAASRLVPSEDESILMVGANAIPAEVMKTFDITTLDISQPLPGISMHHLQGHDYPDHSVAVVGMACRFPGADSPEELWALLTEGRSMLRSMPAERFDPKDRTARAPGETKFWGNFLSDIKGFDHKFFNKKPREAVSMDPQQRILLEVAYEALQSAAYFSSLPMDLRDRATGCWIGACSADYDDNIASHSPTAYSTTGVIRAFLSGKISHHFGFSGPAITLDTACSSSAVAIHMACTALQTREVSTAVAGGATITSSPYHYENLAAAQFLSPTGATKPFDAAADGYCRGEGIGLIVLKRLEDAIRDADNIHGVIVGSAINQNNNCVPITVPHPDSQAQLYKSALRKATLNPKKVTFVEAHGTGTPVGDPVELGSIREVFGGSDRDEPLYVTSIKGNIGHLEGASGVAAIIKALLQMKKRSIPKQASFKTLSNRVRALESDKVRIPVNTITLGQELITACINNYGAAGSNATLMLAEAPARRRPQGVSPLTSAFPILLTANSRDSLTRYAARLHTWLNTDANLDLALADVAFSLARHADHSLSYSLGFIASDISELVQQVSSTLHAGDAIRKRPNTHPVVLCFGGQTNDHVGLDRAIWEMPGPLRSHLDSCDETIKAQGFPSIYPAIFQVEPIDDVVVLHGALFALQYACAMSWLASGLEVDAVIGHSFGQLTALVVSGSLSIDDGIRLVAGRARLVKSHWGSERGVMVAIEASEAEINDRIQVLRDKDADLCYEIACYNGVSSHVVVCDAASASKLRIALEATSTRFKTLAVPYGFHSRFTDPLLADLRDLAQSLCFKPPILELETCSNRESQSRQTSAQIVDHTREPVYFDAAIHRLAKRLGSCTWLEAGSNSGITSMIRHSLGRTTGNEDNFLSQHLGKNPHQAVASTTSTLWSLGHSVNFWFYHNHSRSMYRVLDMPTYSWDHSPHWLDISNNSMIPSKVKSGYVGGCPEEASRPQLLTILPTSDGLHRFTVSTECDEYASMTQGFASSSQLPAPTTIAFQILAAALSELQVSIMDVSHEQLKMIPTTADLVGCQDLVLAIQEVTDGWDFTFTSSSTPDMTPYCAGLVKTRRANSEIDVEFARYERLVPASKVDEMTCNEKSDLLQGRVIYSVYSKIGTYPAQYQLLQSVAVLGDMIAGVISPPTDPKFVPMEFIECFLQVASVHANCLRYDSAITAQYRLVGIENIKWRSSHAWSLDSCRGWKVVGSLTRSRDSIDYDLFVYDSASEHLHVLILGARFTSQAMAVSKPRTSELPAVGSEGKQKPAVTLGAPETMTPRDEHASDRRPSAGDETWSYIEPTIGVSRKQSIYDDLCALLEKLTDVPKEDIGWAATFDDLGVDSLLMMEAIRDISRLFHISLPTSDLQSLTDLESMVMYLEGRGCTGSTFKEHGGVNASELHDDAGSPAVTTPSEEVYEESDSVDVASTTTSATCPSTLASIRNDDRHVDENSLATTRAAQIFENVRKDVQSYINDAGCADFWATVYPPQRRLVLAYTIECFQALGCDLLQIPSGHSIPRLTVAPKYSKLLDRLHEILIDGGIVRLGPTREHVRTSKCLDTTASRDMFDSMLEYFPTYANETKLLNITASCLSDCITGRTDPLELLFADKAHRELMAETYQKAPMAEAMTSFLADYLSKTLEPFDSKYTPERKAQILEVGAGTGGTARYVIRFLQEHNIEFEYTYTDISPALVSYGKKTFAQQSNMHFGTWDCNEKSPLEYRSRFDVVISTNCIHATRNARVTAENLHSVLNQSGVFCLIEFTRPLYWFDLVFGLLDGWWVFDDGRQHALADEKFWSSTLQGAGFENVSWSDGDSREARTMQLIIATKQPYASSSVSTTPHVSKRAGLLMQEVQWLRRAGVDLYADIYLPKMPDASEEKRPIALLFHGGGHLLFGRKDIPMKHVRELLKRGFLPISIDYRLCPEVGLYEGPYMDSCAALRWAREELPHISLGMAVRPDISRLVAVGWSSGGQLAMSLGFTGPQQGVRPPDAIFALYAPTDLQHEHWYKPCRPAAAEEEPQEIEDILSGIQDCHVTEYTPTTSQKTPGLSLTLADPRAKIVLHMNWHAQSVPTLLRGLPSKAQLAHSRSMQLSDHGDWKCLPTASESEIHEVNPLSHVRDNSYTVPTFMVHGDRDDWIATSMSVATRDELRKQNVPVELIITKDCGHAFDMFPDEDPLGVGWEAIDKGYDWVCQVLQHA